MSMTVLPPIAARQNGTKVVVAHDEGPATLQESGRLACRVDMAALTLISNHKSIAEFRRMHRDAVVATGADSSPLPATADLFVVSRSPSMAQSFALWAALTALANDSLCDAISKASRKPTKNSRRASIRLSCKIARLKHARAYQAKLVSLIARTPFPELVAISECVRNVGRMIHRNR
jgi:hypothetical protein